MKNIIFDVDGVIRRFKDSSRPLKEVLSSSELDLIDPKYVSLDDAYSLFFEMNDTYRAYIKGLFSEEEMVEFICSNYKFDRRVVDKLVIYRKSNANNVIFEDTMNLIRKLHDMGFNIYILSNMPVSLAESIKEWLDESLFEDIIFSCDVHMMKPDDEIYEYVLKKWKIEPSESVFVDDRATNLEPFEKLGLHTFLFNKRDVKTSVEALEKYILEN